MVKVKNMLSPSGNPVGNQFVVETKGCTYFQSYNSIIVQISSRKTFLDENYWNYSRTTGKYRNIFLGETTKETQKKIDDGTYILTDLN